MGNKLLTTSCFFILSTLLLLSTGCSIGSSTAEGPTAVIELTVEVRDNSSLEPIGDAEISVSASATADDGTSISFSEESEDSNSSGTAYITLSETVDESMEGLEGNTPELDITITCEGYDPYTTSTYAEAFEWVEDSEKYLSEDYYKLYLEADT